MLLAVNMVACTTNVIAQVDDIEVSKEEYKKTEEFLDICGLINEEEKDSKEVDASIVSFIIDNEVVYQKAKGKGYKASEDEINNKYEALQSSLINNSSYKEKLDNEEIDVGFFKSQVEKDIIIEKYKNEFIKDIVVNDEEIEDYYNNHKDEFDVEEIKASQILISTLDEYNKSVSIEEKEELKVKANDIYEKLNNGESFEKLAKQYSDDKSSGKDGGDLGYFSKVDKNSQFTNIVFKLENNKTSEIFETIYGYHIVKVTDKKVVSKMLEESKEEIKTKIINEKYINHVDSLYKDSKITIAK